MTPAPSFVWTRQDIEARILQLRMQQELRARSAASHLPVHFVVGDDESGHSQWTDSCPEWATRSRSVRATKQWVQGQVQNHFRRLWSAVAANVELLDGYLTVLLTDGRPREAPVLVQFRLRAMRFEALQINFFDTECRGRLRQVQVDLNERVVFRVGRQIVAHDHVVDRQL